MEAEDKISKIIDALNIRISNVLNLLLNYKITYIRGNSDQIVRGRITIGTERKKGIGTTNGGGNEEASKDNAANLRPYSSWNVPPELFILIEPFTDLPWKYLKKIICLT